MLEELDALKKLLKIDNDSEDEILTLFLENAGNIICEIRNTVTVEPKYKLTQIKIAIELYNKMGVEGQTSHSENGISRGYENAGISKSLLDEITPFAKTPFSEPRSVL